MPLAGKKDVSEDAWVSLFAAAREAGEGRLTILTRAIKGELEAKVVAGRTVISRESLNKLLKKGARR